MNIQVAGLTIRGLEGSSVYQYIYSLGYQDGFRDYFDQAWQDKFGAAEQTSPQPLYQQAWQATGRTFEKWRDFFGIETTADFQANLREDCREDCRDGFRACFELTFKEFHEADDEETYEHLFELAWRKTLIAQITRLIEKRSMPLRFDGASVRIRHLSELENLWLDFNRMHWMTLAEDHPAFFTQRA